MSWSCGMEIFRKFENEEYVYFDELRNMVNYICGHISSVFSQPNYKYWYNQYSYSSKAYIVCSWRKSKRLQPVAKKVETICKDELVNFLKDEKHKN